MTPVLGSLQRRVLWRQLHSEPQSKNKSLPFFLSLKKKKKVCVGDTDVSQRG